MNIKLAADELINLANSLSANEDVSPEEFKEKLVYTFGFLIVILMLGVTASKYVRRDLYR